ncbi:ERFE protein, partial [Pterocles burchelli]|nr:ERFE protein [Pterocles burchelli]
TFPHPQPESEQMFHGGLGLNLTTGQYTAPVAGYYTFMAKLHIGESLDTQPQLCQGAPPAHRVLRTGQSSLLRSVRLCPVPGEAVPALSPLSLQAGQFASVSVDNTAGSPLTIQRSSVPSAILLGV